MSLKDLFETIKSSLVAPIPPECDDEATYGYSIHYVACKTGYHPEWIQNKLTDPKTADMTLDEAVDYLKKIPKENFLTPALA